MQEYRGVAISLSSKDTPSPKASASLDFTIGPSCFGSPDRTIFMRGGKKLNIFQECLLLLYLSATWDVLLLIPIYVAYKLSLSWIFCSEYKYTIQRIQKERMSNLACLLKHQAKRNQRLRLSSLTSLIQKHMSKMTNTKGPNTYIICGFQKNIFYLIIFS